MVQRKTWNWPRPQPQIFNILFQNAYWNCNCVAKFAGILFVYFCSAKWDASGIQAAAVFTSVMNCLEKQCNTAGRIQCHDYISILNFFFRLRCKAAHFESIIIFTVSTLHRFEGDVHCWIYWRIEWVAIDFPAGDGTNKNIYGKFPLLSQSHVQKIPY